MWDFYCGLQSIPGWYIWLYYIDPLTYTVYGLIASQLGDVDYQSLTLEDGQSVTVAQFVTQNYGYKHDFLGYAVLVSIHIAVGIPHLRLYSCFHCLIHFHLSCRKGCSCCVGCVWTFWWRKISSMEQEQHIKAAFLVLIFFYFFAGSLWLHHDLSCCHCLCPEEIQFPKEVKDDTYGRRFWVY